MMLVHGELLMGKRLDTGSTAAEGVDVKAPTDSENV
jgi:hypothetical protein